MTRYDPRGWATAYPKAIMCAVIAITAVMAYGNFITRRGSVLDQPILDRDNFYYQSDEYVHAKRAEGFHAGEHVPFILFFPHGISSVEDLQRIRAFTEKVKARFGTTVLSLSEVSDYRDTGEFLQDDPYIPEVIPADFDLDVWKGRVAVDPSVAGIFVGRDFEWATVIRYLPPDYDEIEEFRNTVEFLEDRTIPWWEWLYKTDIDPPPHTSVGGGVVLRGLLDQGFNADNMTLVAVGVALAIPVLIWSLGSVRDALVGMFGVVLMGLFWTRGSVGIIDWLGFDVRERVYLVLAYANCLVQGVSFTLHKFEALRRARREDPMGDPRSHWDAALHNDPLIGTTGVIAILGFATLYSFQVLSIRELGVFSALAVAFQLVLTLLWVPALHLLTFRNPVQVDAPQQPSPWAARFAGVVDRIGLLCARLATATNPGREAWLVGIGTATLAIVATILAWPAGQLLSKTYPLQLISGTVVQKTGDFLNQPGGPGFFFYELFVEPAFGPDGDKTDIYDPAFLQSASSFIDDLRSDVGEVREVASVLAQVGRVSMESFGKPLPTSREEAAGAFLLVETNLSPAVTRQLFHTGGLRLSASIAGDDTIAMGQAGEEALRLARDRYPELRVSPFGRIALSPQVDRYVREGKPLNLLTSQWVVILVCGLGLWAHNRRLRRSLGIVASVSPLWGGIVMSSPFLFASAAMALLMIALKVPLDAGTAAITALAINASVDFSIYYADSYQEGLARTGTHREAVFYALRGKGRVIIEDMLLNSICFVPLIASRFGPIRNVGWIMVVMLFACAFGALVLMPALFYGCIRSAPARAKVPQRLSGSSLSGASAAPAPMQARSADPRK